MRPFNGLEMNLGSLPRLSNAQSRSISAENPTGEKGKAAMSEPTGRASSKLGRGWKCRGAVEVEPGQTFTLADIEASYSLRLAISAGLVELDAVAGYLGPLMARPAAKAAKFFSSIEPKE